MDKHLKNLAWERSKTFFPSFIDLKLMDNKEYFFFLLVIRKRWLDERIRNNGWHIGVKFDLKKFLPSYNTLNMHNHRYPVPFHWSFLQLYLLYEEGGIVPIIT